MSKKQNIKEKVIKSDKITYGATVYSYSLIMRESKRVASYRIPLYSVRIELITEDGELTSNEAKDVFADVGKALVFYGMLVENLVTPLNLPYILEDEYMV